MPETDKWADFEKALGFHDWYFDYSDDHSMWRRGVDQANHLARLRSELMKVNPERTIAKWNEMAPKDFQIKLSDDKTKVLHAAA